MPDIKVTLVQTALHWENAEENLRMLEGILLPFKHSTDLVVLPEMFSTGFSMRTGQLAEMMNGKSIAWMKRMAEETGAVVTGSLMISDGGKYYNRLVWMRPDGTFEIYDKRHLFSLGDEHRHYTAGNRRLLVTLKEWTICPLVCYDLRFPVWCRNSPPSVHGQQYDVLLFVANWPERRSFAWKHLLQARAIENQCYTAGVNRVGHDGHGVYHSGDSALIDPMGEVVFTQADTPFARTFTLSQERLRWVRENMPFLADGDKFEMNG